MEVTMSQADAVLSTERPRAPRATLLIPQETREKLEAALDRLIGLLDHLDGDPDLEPALGDIAPGYVDEAEGNDPDEEPALGWSGVAQLRLTAQEDGEASLGWANGGSQTVLHADRYGEEAEPSLGSLGGTAMGCTAMGQTAWAGGSADDREQENEHGGDINDEPQDTEEDNESEGGLVGGSGL
jgi:hypothetical protein